MTRTYRSLRLDARLRGRCGRCHRACRRSWPRWVRCLSVVATAVVVVVLTMLATVATTSAQTAPTAPTVRPSPHRPRTSRSHARRRSSGHRVHQRQPPPRLLRASKERAGATLVLFGILLVALVRHRHRSSCARPAAATGPRPHGGGRPTRRPAHPTAPDIARRDSAPTSAGAVVSVVRIAALLPRRWSGCTVDRGGSYVGSWPIDVGAPGVRPSTVSVPSPLVSGRTTWVTTQRRELSPAALSSFAAPVSQHQGHLLARLDETRRHFECAPPPPGPQRNPVRRERLLLRPRRPRQTRSHHRSATVPVTRACGASQGTKWPQSRSRNGPTWSGNTTAAIRSKSG